MKKILFSFLILGMAVLITSCGTKKVVADKTALFEVLTQQADGGANIKFFEILSERDEIAMLQSDPNLKNKIGADDIMLANFIILNMGEKPTGVYSITVENVVELDNIVVVTIKEKSPDPDAMVTQAITYPYAIVKINSKKQIVIK